jgi:hypothetical protein
MQTEALERHGSGTVNVELCFACSGIWFDHMVSVELAPSAVISLFKEINAHRDVTRQSMSGAMSCPRCADALVLSYDVAKSGRFSYFRCVRGDGRFTPFFQFLREKQFVRSLTPAEVEKVKVQMRQVTCSQCGAPIDLEEGSECKYCHAPLSLLDPDAVAKAVQMWSAAQDREHRAPSPGAVAEALMKVQSPTSRPPASMRLGDSQAFNAVQAIDGGRPGIGSDLIHSGIQVLGALLERV